MVKKIIISCILLTFIFATLIIINDTNTENKSIFIDLNESQPLLVLHNEFDNNDDPKAMHHFKHHHKFLMVKINQKYHFIHSLKELTPFDNDHDNIIDQSDPIYGQLYIASYNPRKHTFTYSSLSNTSIRAINLSSINITKNKLVSGEAIVANHHQKTDKLHLVFSAELFPESDLKQLAHHSSLPLG